MHLSSRNESSLFFYAVSLVFLLNAAQWSFTDASIESREACMKATETLYENVELSDAFKFMLRTYNETCREEGLCDYEIHEDTRKSVESFTDNSTLWDLAAVKGTGEAHFGATFYEHKSFKKYATACDDAGGELICVDATVNLNGRAGAVLAKSDTEGVETDVKLKLSSYPVCLTRECEGEDMMVTTLENTAKNAFLKMESVQEEMTTHLESIIKAATVKQVCALSGLDTCEFTVERQECGSAKSPSASTSTRVATLLSVATATALFVAF